MLPAGRKLGCIAHRGQNKYEQPKKYAENIGLMLRGWVEWASIVSIYQKLLLLYQKFLKTGRPHYLFIDPLT
jgi:hypothetical protein